MNTDASVSVATAHSFGRFVIVAVAAVDVVARRSTKDTLAEADHARDASTVIRLLKFCDFEHVLCLP